MLSIRFHYPLCFLFILFFLNLSSCLVAQVESAEYPDVANWTSEQITDEITKTLENNVKIAQKNYDDAKRQLGNQGRQLYIVFDLIDSEFYLYREQINLLLWKFKHEKNENLQKNFIREIRALYQKLCKASQDRTTHAHNSFVAGVLRFQTYLSFQKDLGDIRKERLQFELYLKTTPLDITAQAKTHDKQNNSHMVR